MKKRILSVLMTIVLMASVLPFVSIPEASAAGKWVAAWGTSIVNSSVKVTGVSLRDYIPSNSTIRIELPVMTGGTKLRFRFSNEYGTDRLVINEASVAKTAGDGSAKIQSSTAVPITFGGYTSITIPAGQTLWSDEIDFTTSSLEKVSVSLYFKNAVYITSAGLSNGRTFLGKKIGLASFSSQTFSEKLSSPSEINVSSGSITYHTIPFLSDIDTYSESSNACAAVFIGDSTLVNKTYLHFGEKLADAGYGNISVINEAVIGNKLLSNGTGAIGNLYGAALRDRFYRDALNITGVKYVFVKIGLNDILHQFTKSMANDVLKCTADDIIEGYKDLVRMARTNGVQIYFFTKTPWKGYSRAFLGQRNDLVWSQNAQDMCDALDSWIKNNNYADGYIDCSPLANPADKNALCPSFTLDGAHLTELGSIALADLIPVGFVNAYQNRTAAEINNVSPYAEKNAILRNMNNSATPTEKQTQKPAEKQTQKAADNNTAADSGKQNTTEKATEKKQEKEKSSLFDSFDMSGLSDIFSMVMGLIGGESSDSGSAGNSGSAESGTPAASEAPSFPGLPENPENAYAPIDQSLMPTDATVNIADEGAYVAPTPDSGVVSGEATQIGGSRSVLVVLVLFLVIIIAAAAVLLTVNKKKEEDFIN